MPMLIDTFRPRGMSFCSVLNFGRLYYVDKTHSILSIEHIHNLAVENKLQKENDSLREKETVHREKIICLTMFQISYGTQV